MNQQFTPSVAKPFFRFALFVLTLSLLLSVQSPKRSQAQTSTLGAWTGAGNINTARYNHTTTLLPNGKVLVAGGYLTVPPNSNVLPVPSNSAEIYDPATGQSTPISNMNVARAEHTATLLPNGKVLLVYGRSAELYDPVAGIWTNTAPKTIAHGSGHSATLLPNGRVLVLGDKSAMGEIYDSATGTWKSTFTSPYLESHTATLLANGKVLVVNGNQSSIYDPATDAWTNSGNLKQSRSGHSAVRLLTGQVLVAASNSNFSPCAELYDPMTGQWNLTNSPSLVHFKGAISLMADGRVFIHGGEDFRGTNSTSEFYDPVNRVWYITGDIGTPRSKHSAVALPDGRILAIAGRNGSTPLKSVEVFNPTQPSPPGIWTSNISSGTIRYSHTATLLTNGNVLLYGGTGNSGLPVGPYILILNYVIQYWQAPNAGGSSHNHTTTLLPSGQVLVVGGGRPPATTAYANCILYTPPSDSRNTSDSGKWELTGSLITARQFHTATLLNNGKVLTVGGANDDITLSSAEIYDPTTKLWGGGGFMTTGRSRHTATLLENGKVLVVGGLRNGSALASAEIYDPTSGIWTPTASLKFARYGHTATLLKNGKVLIVAGMSNSLVADCEIYDPVTGQWDEASQLSRPRLNHVAVRLNDGRTVVAGGSGDEGVLNSVEIFDPAANSGKGRWNRGASLKSPRELHAGLLMPNGQIFVFCGRNTNGPTSPSVEIFDPSGSPSIPFSPSNIAPVSASTYRGGTLAPESIVAIFGERLAAKTESGPNFGGTRVEVVDRVGQTRTAPLFFVSPTQINCQIPQGTAVGAATMTLTASSGVAVSTNINIGLVVPGIFSADASGAGLAAAVVLRVRANGEQIYESAVRFDATQNRFVAVPIDVSDPREQVFLILYGTGWRFRSRLSAVTVTVGGAEMETIYAGVQGGFTGLDQINLRLSPNLAGRGEVDVNLTVDGVAANTVKINVK